MGSCLLNLFEVSDDLGGAFLDRLAVGANHKATQTFHEGASLLELTAYTLRLGIGARNGTGIVVAQAAIANLGNHIDGRNQTEKTHRIDLVNRLGRLHTVRQRNIGDLIALIGQIHRQRRLGCA